MASIDKEAYAAQAEEKRRELSNKVIECAKNFHQHPEKIVEFLEFQSRFYRYSTNNTMLIQMQNQGAVFCGSFKYFKDKGYSVKKGEKGMQILVPTLKTFLKLSGDEKIPLSEATKEQKQAYKEGKIDSYKKLYFKVGTVFDISQTNCPKEDYPKLLDLGYSSEQHADLYEKLKEFSENELNCPVKSDAYSSVAMRGFYSPKYNHIMISGNFDDTTKLSILSHELGHAMMHNTEELAGESRSVLQKEFEADAVSIMLYNKFGLEISDSRLDHLSTTFKELTALKGYKPEMLNESLERANKAYKKVSDYLNGEQQQEFEQKSEREQNTVNKEPILPNQVQGAGMMQTI